MKIAGITATGSVLYHGDNIAWAAGGLQIGTLIDGSLTPENAFLIDAPPLPGPWVSCAYTLQDGVLVLTPEGEEKLATLEEQVSTDAAKAEAQKAAEDLSTTAAKIERLWQAADQYTSSYISGVAIGILTIGVLQGLPKCVAVAGWSGAVWAEYYSRKILVTADSVENLDFSSFGPMPYAVPELQSEVGM